MSSCIGDLLLVLRRARSITQEELATEVGITQAALSRYEHNLREPDQETFEKLAAVLGVTVDFLQHDFRMEGAIAADAHMRRQKTTKPADWKRVEARLNVVRMHSSYLLERAPLNSPNFVIQVDPDDVHPHQAAAMLRASWRMPIGPVRNLTRWVESAGVIVVEEDFGTHRIDGMSQWAGDHAVIVVNSGMPTDRKRLTMAHELGHLVLHSRYVDPDAEDQANAFAAEFLMPEHLIAPLLTKLTMGKLLDLKTEWGVSMQALYERAYRLGKVSAEDRSKFYRQLNSRGWKTREPGADRVVAEVPELAISVGQQLSNSGLTDAEISQIVGVKEGATTPFDVPRRTLQIV